MNKYNKYYINVAKLMLQPPKLKKPKPKFPIISINVGLWASWSKDY